jgi:hypothetical protein
MKNDKFFSPTIATSLYDAFTKNGGSAEFERVGPFSDDGHRLFFRKGRLADSRADRRKLSCRATCTIIRGDDNDRESQSQQAPVTRQTL